MAIAFALLFMFPVLLIAFSVFDRLVTFEYNYHRTSWENDGRPIGFFWQPPESDYIQGGRARDSCFRAWLSSTPSWMQDNQRTRGLVQWLRILNFVWNLSWVLYLVLLVSRV